eukprot:m.241141 g.241141  ORF g.241141 m.241141 type:complete len:202 (+) comp13793_c0_seq1:2-607(+)
MAVALGLAGGAAVTGLIAAKNAEREVKSFVGNKVQKKIDKKCAKLDKEMEATFKKNEKKREGAKAARSELAEKMRAKHGLAGAESTGMSGFLLKKGVYNTAMKRRWCTLSGLRITYSEDMDTKEKGFIDLDGANVSIVTDAATDEHQLHIATRGRTYVLQGEAPNPRSRLEPWLYAIQAAMRAPHVPDTADDDDDDDGEED